MKKKLLSLALSLALCLGLSVPASAVKIDSPYDDGLPAYFLEGQEGSGKNWSYTYTPEGIDHLTLQGVKRWGINADRPMIIHLAPGSKNVIDRIEYSVPDPSERSKPQSITFTGTGELIIDLSDPMWDITTKQHGVFYGEFQEVYLNDGLTVTGGLKPGDNEPLTLSAPKDEGGNGMIREYIAGDKPARYLRIGPASSAVPETPAASSFTDVAADSPYAEAVQWAVGQKITSGKTAVTFGPGDTCTVSHILTFLWRASGRPGDKGDERAAVAAWAQGLGIDTGNLSTPCTRSMAVLYMWKAAGSPAPAKTASFADVPSGADYASAVSWAVEKGITNGTGGDTFSPGGTCTRGQIVTFLYRASK